ncbi:glycosyltransferase [Gottfriedia acidiceleris]|uniref:glycosyltransferase n=1 Tax=Gottfriedia acidiceleris TaxID=371036 RepID=UPI002FFF417D
MNVTIINESLNYGGAAKISKIIFNGLLKDNNISINYFYAFHGEEAGSMVNINKSKQIFLSKINRYVLGKQDSNIFKLDKKLKSSIETSDIIHIHNIHDSYISLKNLVKEVKQNDIKVIWTLHDSWLITGRCAVPNECNGWINGCSNCQFPNHYPASLTRYENENLKRKVELLETIKNKLVLVSPSEWLLKNVKSSYFKNYDIRLINNGIDLNNFYIIANKERLREKYGLKGDSKIALFVAANLKDSYKGVEYIHELVAKHKDIIFIIVGNNSEVFEKYSNVKIFNYVHEEKEMNEIYNISDILLTPYKYDNFPTTILEGMACGVAVLGINKGGIPEILKEIGYLTQPENFVEYFGKIDFEELRLNKTKEKIRNYAVNKYSMERMVKEYKLLFEELLNESK